MTEINAAEWNQKHRPGTVVRYYPIAGEKEYRVANTRSEAWVLGHGEPVVLITGQSGGVLLSHLQVVSKLTQDEFVQTIPSDTWANKIHDLAYENFERLWACGNVASDAVEEFNNDAYEFFANNGVETGQATEDPE